MLLAALGRVEGFAIQSPICPGAFSVFFGRNDEESVQFDSPGNYWIIKLGPIIDGAYSYVQCVINAWCFSVRKCLRC